MARVPAGDSVRDVRLELHQLLQLRRQFVRIMRLRLLRRLDRIVRRPVILLRLLTVIGGSCRVPRLLRGLRDRLVSRLLRRRGVLHRRLVLRHLLDSALLLLSGCWTQLRYWLRREMDDRVAVLERLHYLLQLRRGARIRLVLNLLLPLPVALSSLPYVYERYILVLLFKWNVGHYACNTDGQNQNEEPHVEDFDRFREDSWMELAAATRLTSIWAAVSRVYGPTNHQLSRLVGFD